MASRQLSAKKPKDLGHTLRTLLSYLGRHKLLTQFFIRLGVDPEVAAADACKVEHDLSEETFQKMKEHALGGKLPEMEE